MCGRRVLIAITWRGHRTNRSLTDVKAYGLASASGGRDRYWCLIVGR